MNITRTLVLITCLATCLGLSAAKSISETQRMNPVLGPEMKLFNGINLDGWRGFFRDGSTDLAQAFSVKDGVLVCTGQPIGYIQTNRLYENFELIIEWRFDPDKGAGNSGVLMRIIGEDKVWPNCIEAQLHSTHAGDIWNIGEFPMKPVASRTNGRHTRKANPSSEMPLGEWNRYRILMDRGHLVLEVNGVKQNVAQDCRQVPGRIGLQSEGAHIEFRKVSLRPIIAWEAESKALGIE